MTKILLVEDDKSLREIYGVRLLAEGYDIVSAGDGEEALAMAIKERPQLIVSDVMMPKISGFDMLDILRSTTETKGIKVIMMTALSSEDQRERGEALGADRYLVKSQVGIEDVVRTVHEVLGDAPVANAGATNTNVFTQPAARPAAPAPQRPATTPAQPASAPQQPPRPMQQPGPFHQQQQPTASPQAPQQQTPPAPQPAPQQAPAPAAPPAPAPTPSSPQSQAAASPAQGSFGQPQASNLPQPTAPFSTNRPANLGDRIIHPIEQPAKADFGSMMAQELNDTPTSAPALPTQSPQPQAAPTQPQSTAPTTQPNPPQNIQPASPAPNLSFEETPLSRPPQPPAPGA